MNSKAKGKRGELEARDYVRQHWFAPQCIRSAQAGGAFAADLLHAGENLHVEVKRRQRIAATHFMRQAEQDCGDMDVPVVLMREDKYPSWLVVMRIEDTEKFLKIIQHNKETNNGNADDTVRGDQEQPT
tara:strand:- start:1454 stop:1840 length:387 start_codon:yes stop_codon:yes gene_type:complete